MKSNIEKNLDTAIRNVTITIVIVCVVILLEIGLLIRHYMHVAK